MSPDTPTAPYRHHAACRQTTVRPPARRSATSRAQGPADGRAQLAEKALIAPGVKGWLQPQRTHALAARRQRPLLWRSPSGVLRRGSARPSCAQWAHRKLSGQPLGATGAGARAGSVARAPYKKSILAGRSRRLCAEACMPSFLGLLVECQPAAREDGATTAGEQRMGVRRSGGCANNVVFGGLQVERLLAGSTWSAPSHIDRSHQR